MTASGETFGRMRRGPADAAPPSLGEAAALVASGVSWPAIWVGAVAAVATTLILIELGTGLGLSSISAWPNSGASAGTIGVAGGIWLIITQWFASGIGGYMAGRMRTKWTGLHTDEVFFRDTAHGFMTWSVATIIVGIVLAWVAASGVHAVGAAAGSVVQGVSQGAAQATGSSQSGSAQTGSALGDPYYTDLLFRPQATNGADTSNGANNAGGATTPAGGQAGAAAPASNGAGNTANAGNAATRAEATRLIAHDLRSGDVSPQDRAYLAQLVAARTGMSQADAQQRVDQVVNQIKTAEQQARQAADKARKDAATMAIVGALALVIGAFIASASAALGGRLRDEF